MTAVYVPEKVRGRLFCFGGIRDHRAASNSDGSRQAACAEAANTARQNIYKENKQWKVLSTQL